MRRLRIVFAGSTDFSLPCLRVLLARHEVVGILGRADRRGRGGTSIANPVALLAQRCALPLFRPHSLRDPELWEVLAGLRPELLVVASYGLIFPPALLRLFPRGGINLHASLLPRWRGPAPVAWALLSGDRLTGVTAIRMAEEVDGGEILAVSSLLIGARDTAFSLERRLAEQAPGVLLTALRRGSDPGFGGRIQDERFSTYARRFSKREGGLDWSRPAEELERRIRAFNPWPIGYCYAGRRYVRVWESQVSLAVPSSCSGEPGTVLRGGRNLLILSGDGILELQAVQLAGGRIRRAEDLPADLLPPGTILSADPAD